MYFRCWVAWFFFLLFCHSFFTWKTACDLHHYYKCKMSFSLQIHFSYTQWIYFYTMSMVEVAAAATNSFFLSLFVCLQNVSHYFIYLFASLDTFDFFQPCFLRELEIFPASRKEKWIYSIEFCILLFNSIYDFILKLRSVSIPIQEKIWCSHRNSTFFYIVNILPHTATFDVYIGISIKSQESFCMLNFYLTLHSHSYFFCHLRRKSHWNLNAIEKKITPSWMRMQQIVHKHVQHHLDMNLFH